MAKRRSVDCSTLTEVHSSRDLPEVEIISLVSDDLPRYRLRADYLTEFGGYGHDDFEVIRTPVLPKDAATNLTAEQVEGMWMIDDMDRRTM